MTPFGQRPVTAGLVEHAARAKDAVSIPHINKWELFRELVAGKAAFDVSDRDLSVLNALLSFLKGDALSDNDLLVVFPSNRSLSERAHGMAESTLRRHLAALVEAGLILRHDSPNGKRYATRDMDGTIDRAFGFDLRPLLVRGQEIVSAAHASREVAQRMKRLREDCTLLKRDAFKLLEYGESSLPQYSWTQLWTLLTDAHKRHRRVLSFEEREALRADLVDILSEIKVLISDETEDMSANDLENERHYQNSNSESLDIELSNEIGKGEARGDQSSTESPQEALESKEPNMPLALVLKAAPDILPYADGNIRTWSQLVEAAHFTRGMMGISPDAWLQACKVMGPENAATTLACILQRVSEITSPGGYLRALTRKAEDSGFSTGPMVMALLNSSRDAA